MFQTATGEMVLGVARVVVQDAGELTPRITECPMVGCDATFGSAFKRLFKKLLRKLGYALAMVAIAAMLGKALPEGSNIPLFIGAISSNICNSFKQELTIGTHNLTTGAQTFKCALYTSGATLGSGTIAYNSTNEISGTGYSAGGTTVAATTPVLSSNTVVIDFADAVWNSATFTANGCLVYNSSVSNKAVFTIFFGADQSVTAGTFTIQWPAADASNAIIRLT